MQDYIIQKCHEYNDIIDNNMKNVKPVGIFAAENGIDHRKFSEYFKNEFGLTPSECLRLARNRKVEELREKYSGKNMVASFFRFELGFPSTDAFMKFIKRNKQKRYLDYMNGYNDSGSDKKSS